MSESNEPLLPLPQPDDAITTWLSRAQAGDPAAWEQVVDRLYAELKGVARRALQLRSGPITLSPTGLVHDAWERLAARERQPWKDRAHYLAVAARTMRGLLIDHLRAEAAERRGGDRREVTLSLAVAEQTPGADWGPHPIDLDDALRELEALSARQARVAELRLFGGLGLREIAALLEVGLTTVELEWRLSKAWLAMRLDPRA